MSTPQDIPAVDLDPEALKTQAQQETGLSDFGHYPFQSALESLTRALEEEAQLSPLGRLVQHQRILNSLKNRLRMEHWLKKHPEILEEELLPPVVIVGLARTGTTMLHRILASDTRFHAPLWYEVRNPSPYLDWEPKGKDQRIVEAEAEIAALLEANPEIAAIHPMDPIGADEEIMLLEHNFYSYVPNSFTHVPSYGDFVAHADNHPAYEEMKRQFQFLQWQKKQRGESALRWLLKAPHHLHFMGTLLDVFPDAQVIATHRDPKISIPSTASLYYNLWLTGSDQAQKEVVGAEVLDVYQRGIAHTLEVREQKPDLFCDIRFEDTVKDPESVIKRIYEFIGMPLTLEAKTAMAEHRDANQREDRPTHEYSPEDFGYNEAQIDAAFPGYVERFCR